MGDNWVFCLFVQPELEVVCDPVCDYLPPPPPMGEHSDDSDDYQSENEFTGIKEVKVSTDLPTYMD